MRSMLLACALIAGSCAMPPGSGDTAATASTAAATASPDPSAVANPSSAGPITMGTTAAADEIALSIAARLERGETAVVTARTVAGADCTITMMSPIGPTSATELGPKSTDGAGDVSWSWIIAATATPGEWQLEVSCATLSGSRAVGRQRFVVR